MNTKVCVLCHVAQPLENYNRRALSSDGLQTVCRECNRARSRKYYVDNSEKHLKAVKNRKAKAYTKLRNVIIKAKSVPCTDCKQIFPSYVMDFDHVRGEKINNVSKLVQQVRPLRIILEEIAKCEVVCANCHRERTFNRDGWNSDPDLT